MHVLCLNAKGNQIYCLAACRMCAGHLYGNGADKIQKLTHISWRLAAAHQCQCLSETVHCCSVVFFPCHYRGQCHEMESREPVYSLLIIVVV